MGTLLWTLIGGTVIGLLGKWVAPGDRDHVPFWLVIICGMGGVLIGDTLYGQIYDPHNSGVDWWRHAWQIAVAALLVVVAAGLTGRKRA